MNIRPLWQTDQPDLSDRVVHFTGRTCQVNADVDATIAGMSAQQRLEQILTERHPPGLVDRVVPHAEVDHRRGRLGMRLDARVERNRRSTTNPGPCRNNLHVPWALPAVKQSELVVTAQDAPRV